MPVRTSPVRHRSLRAALFTRVSSPRTAGLRPLLRHLTAALCLCAHLCDSPAPPSACTCDCRLPCSSSSRRCAARCCACTPRRRCLAVPPFLRSSTRLTRCTFCAALLRGGARVARGQWRSRHPRTLLARDAAAAARQRGAARLRRWPACSLVSCSCSARATVFTARPWLSSASTGCCTFRACGRFSGAAPRASPRAALRCVSFR